jgi:hypothetical protein
MERELSTGPKVRCCPVIGLPLILADFPSPDGRRVNACNNLLGPRV